MIYFKYIKILFRSFLQYRLSMLLTIIGQLLGTFFSFAGMYLLFERFGTVDGWTFGEVAICFAVVQMAFALTECFSRGFDMFHHTVIQGDFDRVLLRPRATLVQILGSNFEFTKLSRMIEAIVVLWLAISWLDIIWTAAKIFTLIFMVISGYIIFTGVFILGAVVCFFTVQRLEIINIFTDGGREIAAYPLTIYTKWIMRVFTFIIPFGCFNYLPLLFLVGRADGNESLYMLTPLIGCLFIVPCVCIWQFGVKRYLSTGN